jgi:hypothetical protein
MVWWETGRRAGGITGRFRLIVTSENAEGSTDQFSEVVIAVVELLVAVGHLLRICHGAEKGEGCGKLFVRVRRQTFCSAACSQRSRNLRKKLRGVALVTKQAKESASVTADGRSRK